MLLSRESSENNTCVNMNIKPKYSICNNQKCNLPSTKYDLFITM